MSACRRRPPPPRRLDDPVYRAASTLPFVGPNLDAIRQVTVTVDSLATNVMPSLVDVARTLQPSALAPKDGAIDLAPIERSHRCCRRPMTRSTTPARSWPRSTRPR